MWGEQCNTCGGHENSVRSVAKCSHCPTRICNLCRANHEDICETNQKRARRGEGATVRRVASETIQIPSADPITDDSTAVETDPLQQALDEAAKMIAFNTVNSATLDVADAPTVPDPQPSSSSTTDNVNSPSDQVEQ